MTQQSYHIRHHCLSAKPEPVFRTPLLPTPEMISHTMTVTGVSYVCGFVCWTPVAATAYGESTRSSCGFSNGFSGAMV